MTKYLTGREATRNEPEYAGCNGVSRSRNVEKPVRVVRSFGMYVRRKVGQARRFLTIFVNDYKVLTNTDWSITLVLSRNTPGVCQVPYLLDKTKFFSSGADA